jgi:hypothetical protein
MNEQSKRGLRIFLQYWLLIALLAAFNYYKYFTTKSTLSLIMAVATTLIFVGWVLFYYYFVRGKE